mmetsp:Transcript_63314/g.151042  ORF Transcript_63314/g.151042 Transcript_63314/m.151042 type:complete len:298 (+) Transcript_63314:137-1030(+)|eukprot:CAMPEP_0178423566 /NCGR_PEP_ID=MMETSP0689_2-20121128/27754_1 /TAXON_ID=160604 /ORGANISM="Amphidinium massartii, Strain CS-259" /LENGTH=297 /DNA_ID=CAMNT_0020045163 /DNA_START=96 /DNA_END=989 /DNA_ORIENTATION=+
MSKEVSVSILDPKQTAKAVETYGVAKARLSYPRMTVLAVLAGAYIGIGAQLFAFVTSTFDGSAASPPVKFLGGLAFSVGLVFVVIAGAELFTGNCLLLVAWFHRSLRLYEVLIDWIIVWTFNFVGAISISALLVGTGINGYNGSDFTPTGQTVCKISGGKADERAYEMFIRGIFANMLVCLAVILAIASKTPSGKILGVALPVATFVALGFDHSIANMTFFSLATMLSCDPEDQPRYWLNLLLSTLGNILGASILAVSYFFTYVRDERPAEDKDDDASDDVDEDDCSALWMPLWRRM